MARRRSSIENLLVQIEKLTEVQRCELLEQLALRHRKQELGWERIQQIRAKLPRVSERMLKRDIDQAVREVRREKARARHS